jgi:hypothetical protein
LHTSRKEANRLESPDKAVRCLFSRLSPAFHLVWNRVVPDIPDFCRELVAALAEDSSS